MLTKEELKTLRAYEQELKAEESKAYALAYQAEAEASFFYLEKPLPIKN